MDLRSTDSGHILSGGNNMCGMVDTTRETSFVEYGVPQGSVLGSILFIMYIADLVALIQQQRLQPHLYVDDTQIVGSCRPSSADITTLRHRIKLCIADIAG